MTQLVALEAGGELVQLQRLLGTLERPVEVCVRGLKRRVEAHDLRIGGRHTTPGGRKVAKEAEVQYRQHIVLASAASLQQ